MEHLALAIAIRRVHTVEKNGVKMWIESEVTVGALDDCYGAGFARRQAGKGMVKTYCLRGTSGRT